MRTTRGGAASGQPAPRAHRPESRRRQSCRCPSPWACRRGGSARRRLPVPLAGSRRSSAATWPRRIHHRVDDLAVAGAAAKHATKRVAHFFFRWLRIAFEQRRAGDQHAWRADAALGRAMLEEGRLQRRKLAVGEAFDGTHRAAGNAGRRNQAGADRLVVQHHRAGAAIAGVTADLGAGEMQFVAQHRRQPLSPAAR